MENYHLGSSLLGLENYHLESSLLDSVSYHLESSLLDLVNYHWESNLREGLWGSTVHWGLERFHLESRLGCGEASQWASWSSQECQEWPGCRMESRRGCS